VLWRLLFIAGLLLGAFIMGGFAGLPPMRDNVPAGLLVVAGLLVGFGTAQARGCTSGHGVCGISRLSLRSIVATVTFMAVAIVVVFITRHVIGR
jgi:uncharacterized protein